MKRTAGTLYFITVMFLLVACGPAIAIRQIRASNGTSAPITIDVKTRYPLVGERIYEPQVTVTNGSDLPITITSVELAAKQGTYANKPRQPGSYPSTVPPGKTERSTSGSTSPMTLGKLFFDSPPSCECATRIEVATKPLMCQL